MSNAAASLALPQLGELPFLRPGAYRGGPLPRLSSIQHHLPACTLAAMCGTSFWWS